MISKELKIGFLTIVAIALFYFGFNYLRGIHVFDSIKQYYVSYPNVTGLNESNAVYFNGLLVGRVSKLELQQKKGVIIVALDIDENVILSQDATATLANDGLFGGKAIILNVGTSKELMQNGDTLLPKIDDDLLSQFEPVADNLNSTITRLNTLLDQMNKTDLVGVVEELKTTLITINQTVEKIPIKKTMSNTNQLLENINQRILQLDLIFTSSQILIDSLKELPTRSLLENINATVNELKTTINMINSGNGSMGKLIKEDELYENLNQLIIDLNTVIIHFNQYPKDFLKPLGRKNKKLKGANQ